MTTYSHTTDSASSPHLPIDSAMQRCQTLLAAKSSKPTYSTIESILALFRQGPITMRFDDIFYDYELYSAFQNFALEKFALSLLHCVRDILWFKYAADVGDMISAVLDIAVSFFGWDIAEEGICFKDMKVSVQICPRFEERLSRVLVDGELDMKVFDSVLVDLMSLLRTMYSEFCDYVVQFVYNDEIKKKKFYIMPLNERFDEILYDDFLYSQFEAFLVSCFCNENLNFYKEVTQFKARKSKSKTVLANAIKIANKYLREDSEYTITNEFYSTIPNILKKIDQGKVTRKIFDKIYNGVGDVLETKFIEFCGVIQNDPRRSRTIEYEKFRASKLNQSERFDYLIFDPYLYYDFMEFMKKKKSQNLLKLYYDLYNIVHLHHMSNNLTDVMVTIAKTHLAYGSNRRKPKVNVSENFKAELFEVLDNEDPLSRKVFFEFIQEIEPEVRQHYSEFTS